MKFLLQLVIAPVLALGLGLIPSFAEASPKAVRYVDINRYLGDWYEIASIPQTFSQGCNCTRARYSLNKDRSLNVLNTCNKNSVSGPLSSANGTAEVVDKKSNAKLSVTFFWPFSGAYWIIGLDKDYRYAVVSNEDGSSLWILSRTPVLADDLRKEALKIARANGADVGSLKVTRQASCRYP